MTRSIPRLLALGVLALLSACATQAPRAPQRSPQAVQADIARRLPASLSDRAGWASDVYVALASQDIATTPEHICAVLAVTEQESTYQANPPVPNLGKISRAEIDRRASAHHLPGFMVDAALRITSPDFLPCLLTGKTRCRSGWASAAICLQSGHSPHESPPRRWRQQRYCT